MKETHKTPIHMAIQQLDGSILNNNKQ